MRHPLLFWTWVVMGVVAALSPQISYGLIALVLLVSPMLALATLVMVSTEATDVIRHRWMWPYRAAMAVLAILAATGLALTATQESTHTHNAAVSVLFLGVFIFSWRALVNPTPRRATAPAAFLHVGWAPLLITNVMMETGCSTSLDNWKLELAWYCGGGIMIVSAIGAMFASAAFRKTETNVASMATIRR